MGLFGLTIPEEYGGLGRVAADLRAGGRGDRPRLDERVAGSSTRTSSSRTCCMQHGTDGAEAGFLPRMATGEVRGAFSMSEPGCGSDVAAITTKAVPRRRRLRRSRPEDVAHQRRLVQPGRRAGQDRRGRRSRVYQNMTTFLVEKEAGLRRGRARAHRSRARSRRWATRASTRPSWSSTATGSGRRRSSAAQPGQGFYQMMDGVEVGRVNVAARGCGVALRAFELGVALRPAARDVRQADRRAPGRAVPARRDGHQGRGRAPDDGQGGAQEGLRRAQRPRGRDGEVPRVASTARRSSRTPSASTAATASPRSTRSSGSTGRRPMLLIGEGTADIQRMIIGRRLLEDYALRR